MLVIYRMIDRTQLSNRLSRALGPTFCARGEATIDSACDLSAVGRSVGRSVGAWRRVRLFGVAPLARAGTRWHAPLGNAMTHGYNLLGISRGFVMGHGRSRAGPSLGGFGPGDRKPYVTHRRRARLYLVSSLLSELRRRADGGGPTHDPWERSWAPCHLNSVKDRNISVRVCACYSTMTRRRAFV